MIGIAINVTIKTLREDQNVTDVRIKEILNVD